MSITASARSESAARVRITRPGSTCGDDSSQSGFGDTAKTLSAGIIGGASSLIGLAEAAAAYGAAGSLGAWATVGLIGSTLGLAGAVVLTVGAGLALVDPTVRQSLGRITDALWITSGPGLVSATIAGAITGSGSAAERAGQAGAAGEALWNIGSISLQKTKTLVDEAARAQSVSDVLDYFDPLDKLSHSDWGDWNDVEEAGNDDTAIDTEDDEFFDNGSDDPWDGMEDDWGDDDWGDDDWGDNDWGDDTGDWDSGGDIFLP